jgi:hypothetical protein
MKVYKATSTVGAPHPWTLECTAEELIRILYLSYRHEGGAMYPGMSGDRIYTQIENAVGKGHVAPIMDYLSKSEPTWEEWKAIFDGDLNASAVPPKPPKSKVPTIKKVRKRSPAAPAR